MIFKHIIQRSLLLATLSASTVFAEDLMVERMQSVVDEVSELRARYEQVSRAYETCQAKTQEQVPKASEPQDLHRQKEQSYIKELEFENEKLKEVHQAAKTQAKRLQELEQELEASVKERNRLNTSAEILVEKNHALIEQLNKLKRTKISSNSSSQEPKTSSLVSENRRLQQSLQSSNSKIKKLEQAQVNLEKELTASLSTKSKTSSNTSEIEKKNRHLQAALSQCQALKKTTVIKTKSTRGLCVDDNPFPKLLKKEPQKSSSTQKAKSTNKASGVYRMRGENAVYDKINGEVIAIWEDRRSFTSNVSKDGWIKITGYFVDRKWRRAKNEIWIQKEHTLKR